MKRILLCFILFFTQALPANGAESHCLARAIYHEARGESTVGKLAVAHTISNRVSDPRFPKSICGVIQQKGQFPWFHKKLNVSEKEAWQKSQKLAISVLAGKTSDPTNGALFFNSVKVPGTKKPTRIGRHTFSR